MLQFGNYILNSLLLPPQKNPIKSKLNNNRTSKTRKTNLINAIIGWKIINNSLCNFSWAGWFSSTLQILQEITKL